MVDFSHGAPLLLIGALLVVVLVMVWRIAKLEARLRRVQRTCDAIDDQVRGRLDRVATGEALGDIAGNLASLRVEVGRAWSAVDVIRTHMSSYLGQGRAVTLLRGDVPIFVNTDDYGGPTNLMNGGIFEDDNLDVMFSFLRWNSVFVDIGANLGFFTVVFGRRLRGHGRVLAFEPHPEMIELLSRSVYVNHLMKTATCYGFGLGDREFESTFVYPKGHIGGGSAIGDQAYGVPVHQVDRPYHPGAEQADTHRLKIKRLDDVVGGDFRCDVVKIDVEGQESSVLRGMRGVIERSPGIKILIEKINTDPAWERELADTLESLGLSLYAVDQCATLRLLDRETMRGWDGYVLATREPVAELDRRFFRICPRDLQILSGTIDDDRLTSRAARDGVLFYGPYWPLRAGRWRIRLEGEVEGRVRIEIAERDLKVVTTLVLEPGEAGEFHTPRDLVDFQCRATACDGEAAVRIGHVELRRLD